MLPSPRTDSMAAAAGLSPAGDGLGCELTSVWLQPADVSTISWSNFATVVLRAAAATGDTGRGEVQGGGP